MPAVFNHIFTHNPVSGLSYICPLSPSLIPVVILYQLLKVYASFGIWKSVTLPLNSSLEFTWPSFGSLFFPIKVIMNLPHYRTSSLETLTRSDMCILIFLNHLKSTIQKIKSKSKRENITGKLSSLGKVLLLFSYVLF